MRRVLFSFLIFTMLTPMMVCSADFGIFGIKEAKAENLCHNESTDTDKMSDDLMFMLDCMNVDLKAVSNDVSLKKPDLQTDRAIYSYANNFFVYSFLPTGQNAIRGSPDLNRVRSAAPSLILTTQRFRI